MRNFRLTWKQLIALAILAWLVGCVWAFIVTDLFAPDGLHIYLMTH